MEPGRQTFCFFTRRNDNPTWNPSYSRIDEEYIAASTAITDADGRKYTLDNMTSPKPHVPKHDVHLEGACLRRPAGWRYSKETMEKLDGEGRIWYSDSKSKRYPG